MSLTRTRWAAIGAAIAVTLGAGGLFVASAANDASVFYPIVPTRVLDTRPATNVGLTGKFQSLTARKLTVTGTIDTSEGTKQVVPAGATAIAFNVTAVRPSADGFVSVRPGDATGIPKTSSLNFAAGAVLGNGGTVSLPLSGSNAGQVDILYKGATAGATADVVLDVIGYYAVGTGAPGPKGDTGDTGPKGDTGQRGLSAWDTIPSGVTVTGDMIYDRSVINPGTDGRIHISLPAKAPVDLTNATVNFAQPDTIADDEDAACTGTYSAPTAPSGKVCLYRFISENVDHIDGRSSFMLADSGFYINFIETGIAGNDLYLNFSWAYTAP